MKRCAAVMGLLLSLALSVNGGPGSPSIPPLGRAAPKPVYYDTFPSRPHITISASWTITVTNEFSDMFSTRAFEETVLEWTGIQTNEAAPLLPKPNAVADPRLAGGWYCGDGRGYNLSLDLRPDGTYDGAWHGCLGLYGTAKGRWGADTDLYGAKHIYFSPSEEIELMKGHIRKLEVREVKRETVLLSIDAGMQEFFTKYGPSDYSCFRRRSKTTR
jgi:hypothetical protein